MNDVVPVISTLAAWQLDQRRQQDELEARRILAKKKSKSRGVIESLIEAEHREISYDDWQHNAAMGKYDRWLKRSGSWVGEVSVALFADNLPDDGIYVFGKSTDECAKELVRLIPLYHGSRAPSDRDTLNNEIVLNNAALFVAEAGTNRLFEVYSNEPATQLNHAQLAMVLKEFDVNTYDELQWANGLGRSTRTISTSAYLGLGGDLARRTKVQRVSRSVKKFE